MPQPPLNADIWVTIFGFVAEDDEDPELTHPMCSVTLVCKAWKILATPLLYRRTLFHHPSSLEVFLHHLVRREASSCQPGTFVHTLILGDEFTEYSEGDNRDLLSVLLLLPNLRSITSTEFCLSYRELNALVATCAATLYHMDVPINGPSGLAATALSKLTSLRHLRMNFAESVDDFDGFEDALALHMEQVHILEVCLPLDQDYQDSRSILWYLNQCHFPALRRFGIFSLLPQHAGLLEPFLTRHVRQLDRVDLEDFWPSSFSDRLIPNLRHVGFNAVTISMAASLYHIPCTALYLHIKSISATVSHLSANAFDDIISGKCGASLETIHLEDPGFTWKHVYLRRTNQTGNWLKTAIRLQERGIWLMDANGVGWNLSKAIQPLKWTG